MGLDAGVYYNCIENCRLRSPRNTVVRKHQTGGHGSLDRSGPVINEFRESCETCWGALGYVGGGKAVATFKESVAVRRKQAKPDDPQFAGLLAQVALDLLKSRQHAAAEEFLRECLAIREKTQPDLWTTFNSKSMLGAALRGQKKYADAEPLLLKGYEGMKQRETSIPSQAKIRIPEALDRLIELYTATNKPDEVKKWKAERAKYPTKEPTKNWTRQTPNPALHRTAAA